ncbi:hypothetical protein OIO90_001347 [Microbotryomycetes sp. JL221]|nr:hypothetical protein OIO90_001347 [Microbotryomycetes sp. JL221]
MTCSDKDKENCRAFGSPSKCVNSVSIVHNKSNDPVMERIKDKVRQTRRDSEDARGRLLAVDRELTNLRIKYDRMLTESAKEKLDWQDALGFAEAEAKAAKEACQVMETELQEMQDQLVKAGSQYEDVLNERDEVQRELTSTKKDLKDAIARELLQAESAQNLLEAQRELEVSYNRAVAEFEEWKLQHNCGNESELSLPSTSITDGELETIEQEAESYTSSDGDEYDMVQDAEVTITIPRSPLVAVAPAAPIADRPVSRAKMLGTKFKRLMMQSRSSVRLNKPSRRAIQLFAERELEDDFAEQQQSLFEVCDTVGATSADDVKALTKSHEKLDDTMHRMRLTATKLKAVRSMSK